MHNTKLSDVVITVEGPLAELFRGGIPQEKMTQVVSADLPSHPFDRLQAFRILSRGAVK